MVANQQKIDRHGGQNELIFLVDQKAKCVFQHTWLFDTIQLTDKLGGSHLFETIMLERTMCYGNCPIYRVEIYHNGIVRWEGIEFVSKVGSYSWKISQEKIKKLHKLLLDFDFRTYDYQPTGLIKTDHPSCITTVRYCDGFKKEINHYLGDELLDESITVLETEIEKLAGTRKYIRQPLYMYRIIHRQAKKLNDSVSTGYVVVANNVKEAFDLLELTDTHHWIVDKIGKDTSDKLQPYVLMREKYQVGSLALIRNDLMYFVHLNEVGNFLIALDVQIYQEAEKDVLTFFDTNRERRFHGNLTLIHAEGFSFVTERGDNMEVCIGTVDTFNRNWRRQLEGGVPDFLTDEEMHHWYRKRFIIG
ncbi:DUF6438 domain-containing protein [Brevibacillus nitrificans]|uniref:DUF6438 domain-containing protein n=1 Tax=Brevibacillus nitrificans TaxID=651560 RepID=UPI002854510B|nr:DUF6438 domain-containing protein [Brevibacillus nitrificans]MDR7316055.1 hypothetical protein [Brevibacillus nitrificans]